MAIRKGARERQLRRYQSRVSVGAENSCWEWSGPMHTQGYGIMYWEGRAEKSHRIAFELAKGSIPAGAYICHTCDNRTCCNPAHLFLGDHLANMQDKARKDRAGRKLSNAQAAAIRVDPRTQSAIAAEYGISQPMVGRIKLGKARRYA